MGSCLEDPKDGYAGGIEVLDGRSGRLLWSLTERARIANATPMPEAKNRDIARRRPAKISQ